MPRLDISSAESKAVTNVMPWWAWLLLSIFGPVIIVLCAIGITVIAAIRRAAKDCVW